MYDIIIIGAGPSGLTAGIYGRRANKKVLILEAKTYGGQIINASKIDNYPGLPGINGIDFATSLYNQVINLGAEVKFEKAIRINYDNDVKEVITNENTYTSKAIIIATGSDKRKMGLEKEDYFIGRGISYCATCDGNFYKDKDVIVYGGGDTALDDAMYLSSICKNIYLVHRRDTFRGNELTVNELKNKDNVHFILNSTITKLLGEDKLTGVLLSDNSELKVDGLFVAIGQIPETENFINILDCNSNGYVISNDMQTKVKGIYVCGDVREKDLRQLTTAISDGAIAATKAITDINNKII